MSYCTRCDEDLPLRPFPCVCQECLLKDDDRREAAMSPVEYEAEMRARHAVGDGGQ